LHLSCIEGFTVINPAKETADVLAFQEESVGIDSVEPSAYAMRNSARTAGSVFRNYFPGRTTAAALNTHPGASNAPIAFCLVQGPSRRTLDKLPARDSPSSPAKVPGRQLLSR